MCIRQNGCERVCVRELVCTCAGGCIYPQERCASGRPRAKPFVLLVMLNGYKGCLKRTHEHTHARATRRTGHGEIYTRVACLRKTYSMPRRVPRCRRRRCGPPIRARREFVHESNFRCSVVGARQWLAQVLKGGIVGTYITVRVRRRLGYSVVECVSQCMCVLNDRFELPDYNHNIIN